MNIKEEIINYIYIQVFFIFCNELFNYELKSQISHITHIKSKDNDLKRKKKNYDFSFSFIKISDSKFHNFNIDPPMYILFERMDFTAIVKKSFLQEVNHMDIK